MASDQVTNSVPVSTPQLQPLQAWLARLGLSGKLLAGGGLVGLVAVFLPLVSTSMQTPTHAGKGAVNLAGDLFNHTWLVVSDFRGILCLLGYGAALALAYVLYQAKELNPKTLGWAGAGVGAFIALLALWMLLGGLSGSGSLMGLRISVGIGAYLNVLAAGAVAAGGFLKAREEKLI